MDYLTFNNTAFSTYGTYFDGSQLFDTPEKDVTFYPVVGKNGDLSISNDRYKNVNIDVNCFIRENFIDNFNGLMNFLLAQKGYGRLETSKETDIYRMAEFVASIEPDTGAFLKYGSFTLQFNCKPQKWLKAGETAVSVTTSAVLKNPTLMAAKPLIEVTGTGTITVNTSVLVLSANTNKTYIDCELQDAYEGTINRNGDLTVTNGFPVLTAGDNAVSVDGCTIKITPRWWRL